MMSPSFKLVPVFLSALIVTACGGGGGGNGGGGSSSLVDLGISASSDADAGSSYENAKADIHINYYGLPFQSLEGRTPLIDAIGYLDADGDGDTDVFLATGSYLYEGEVPSQMFINDGSESFTFDNIVFNGNPPPATHARKTLVADLNGDSLMDLFVLDHGYDADPFPGSNPKQIMQTSTGSFSWVRKTDQTGFHHGGSAADIDNDGDIDIFVGGSDPFFYINDGQGNLTLVADRFGGSIAQVFTAEMFDLDRDGFMDLLVGAHEQDGDTTAIYWGSSTGSYSDSLRTVIPAVTGYGVVLDFDAEDVDGDGLRDLVVNRTGSGPNAFYQGIYLQLLTQTSARTFADGTSSIDDNGQAADSWFPWVRMQDIDNDGDIDIFSDDKGDDFLLLNDGSGSFTRTGFF